MRFHDIEWHMFEYNTDSPPSQLIDVKATTLTSKEQFEACKFLVTLVKRGEFGLSTVVYVTQPALSEGTLEYYQNFRSSRAVELIATSLHQQFDLEPARTFWLWHNHEYDNSFPGPDDNFWLLTFSWDGNRATDADVIGCSRELAESLVGEAVLNAATELHKAMQVNLNYKRQHTEEN